MDPGWAAFQDEMAGIGYYHFIENLEKDFEAKKDEIVQNLQLVMGQILCQENMSISYTGEKESVEMVKTQFVSLKKAYGTYD